MRHIYIIHVLNIPYNGKFSRDKIFTDGSKNENSRIKFSQMLGKPQNPQKFCPANISRYTVLCSILAITSNTKCFQCTVEQSYVFIEQSHVHVEQSYACVEQSCNHVEQSCVCQAILCALSNTV